MKIRTMDDATIRQVVAGQEHVQAEVSVELQRQLAKWGLQSHAPLSWLGILGEEVGEACKAAIEWGLHTSEAESRAALRAELIQVAAVAIAAAECLDRTRGDEKCERATMTHESPWVVAGGEACKSAIASGAIAGNDHKEATR